MPALADRAVAGAGGRRWADLRTRTLSAVLLGPAVLACIWAGGWFWAVLALAASVVLATEWVRMAGRPGGIPAQLAVLGGMAAAVGFAITDDAAVALAVLVAAGGLALLASRSVSLAAGPFYLGVPMLCLARLRSPDMFGADDPARTADLLFVVAIVWASDIGAYIAGRLLGGPKLAPSISPGKTWSGAAGGLVAAMLAGLAVAAAFGPAVPGHAAVTAAILGIASQTGDLVESWIKRRFGVKDSGTIIPGHGGLLDRLDGLLAAAAAATLLMNTGAFGRGGVLWT